MFPGKQKGWNVYEILSPESLSKGLPVPSLIQAAIHPNNQAHQRRTKENLLLGLRWKPSVFIFNWFLKEYTKEKLCDFKKCHLNVTISHYFVWVTCPSTQRVRSHQLSRCAGLATNSGDPASVCTGPFCISISIRIKIAAEAAVLVLIKPTRKDGDVASAVVNHQSGTRRRNNVDW